MSTSQAGEGRESQGVNIPARPVSSHHPYPRSCVTCRQRKVRCSRLHPCTNCVKAGIECIFPGPGRAKRYTKSTDEIELASRLQKVEQMLQRLTETADEPARTGDTDAPTTLAGSGCASDGVSEHGSLSPQSSHIPESEVGRLFIKAGQKQYMNDSFWANSGGQITDVVDVFDTPSSIDNTETASQDQQSESIASSQLAFLFGHTSTNDPLKSLYASRGQAFILSLIFEERCDPIVKVTHRPTIKKLFLKLMTASEELSREEGVLILAIYYGAVCSLTQAECQEQLGERHNVLAARLRAAVEQALAQANFMINPTLTTLQAFVLYLVFLRSQDDMRLVGALVGLAIYLARFLGLHRDGTRLGLGPFETEMRRRLWWQIGLLDLRSTEDQGTEPTFLEGSYDTKLPLNINDDDFSPEIQSSPREREGTTEMTFSLIRFDLSRIARRLDSNLPSKAASEDTQSVARALAEIEKSITEADYHIVEKYLEKCDLTVPIYWVAATVSRLVLAKLRLLAYHPLQYSRDDSHGIFTHNIRERLFNTSVKILEYSCLLENHEKTMHWRWLFRTYTQWHAMAFVLSELQHDPYLIDYERAWRAVKCYYDKRVLDCPQNQKGGYWQPLRELMARAQNPRAVIGNTPSLSENDTSTKDQVSQLARNPIDNASDNLLDTMTGLAQARTTQLQMQKPSDEGLLQESLVDTNMEQPLWDALHGHAQHLDEHYEFCDFNYGSFSPNILGASGRP